MDDENYVGSFSVAFDIHASIDVMMNRKVKRVIVRVIALMLALFICLPVLFLTGCSAPSSEASSTPESASSDMEWQEPTFDMEKLTDRVFEIEVTDAAEKYIFTVDWQNTEVVPTVEITAPNGTVFSLEDSEIARVSGSSVSMLVDPAENGMYSVHVVGNGLGNISILNSSWKGSDVDPVTNPDSSSAPANSEESSEPANSEESSAPANSEESSESVSSPESSESTVDELDLKKIVNESMSAQQQLAYPAMGKEALAAYFPNWDASIFEDIVFSVADANTAHTVLVCRAATDRQADMLSALSNYASVELIERFQQNDKALSIASQSMLVDIGGYTVLIVDENVNDIFINLSESLGNV